MQIFPFAITWRMFGHGNILVAYFVVLGCRFYDWWAEDLSIDFETSTLGWLICSSKPSSHFPLPFSVGLHCRHEL